VITKGQGQDVITDFHVHAGTANGDLLALKGFGPGATMLNHGPVFTITASDGSVEQVTLLGVSQLGSGDYVFT
jgi:hypothetical protein